MLGQWACSGEKPLPCLPTGYHSKTMKNPFLHLPHHLHHHQFIILCPLLLPSSTTIKFPRPQDHCVVVAHLVFRIGPLMTCAKEPRPTNPRLTPLDPLLPAPDSH